MIIIIKSINLKNFISHQNSQIEFPLGVSLLVGPNGAGKSAVIDAILYSLTGDKVRGDSVDDIIREGAKESNIILDFELGGATYRITRQRKRKGNPTSTLMGKGRLLADSQTEVTNEILKSLSMDKDTLINSIFIRQGEITSLIDADPAERKETIGKLIGLDKLEKAYVNMKKIQNHFEEKASAHKEVNKEVEVRNETSLKLNEEIETLSKEVEKINKNIKTLQPKLKKQEEMLVEYEKKQEKYTKINNNISVLKERIKITQEKLSDLNKELEEAKKAQEEAKKIEPQIKDLAVLEEYLKDLNEKTSIEKEIGTIHKELERVKSLLATKTNNKEGYEKYLLNDQNLNDYRKEQQEIKEEEIKYAKISQEIQGLEKNEKELSTEVSQIKKVSLKYLPSADIEQWEKAKTDLANLVDELEKEIADLQNSNGKIKGRIDEINQYLTILGDGDQCPVCNSKLTEDHRDKVAMEFTAENEDLNKNLKQNAANKEKLEKKRKSNNKELEKIRELKIEDLVNKESKINELKSNINALKSTQKEKAGIIKKAEELNLKIQSTEKLLKELKEAFDDYNAVELSLKEEREIGKINEELKKFQKDNSKIEKAISALISKMKKVPEDPEKELERLRELAKQFERFKTKAESINDLLEREENEKNEVNISEKDLEKLNKEIEQLNYDKNTHEDVKMGLDKLKDEQSKLEEAKKIHDTDLAKKYEEQKELIAKIEELKEKMKKFENILKFLPILDEIRTSFSKDGIQKFLRQRLAPKITENAKKYLENFNLDITDISVDENFNISLYGRSGEISVKSISGGEKVAVAIALRLAIGQSIAGSVSTIIMDEPTTHLDEERRRELVKIMNDFLRGKSSVPQIIIVTHHQELEDLADTIYQVKKVDNISRIKELSY